ncbi:formate C-acetyltransferase/glycerol dehydratase family glycyl radical enzyme [Mediterraneibacter sp. NSJ-55]|uniref:Formate C-acetyltransferase/glycerol dehydratase family glycyl radical enzyme n=1 Tax=Mediterraneibacter hominis TaxID=2763054 RepID=A0A923LHQ9_9FIRM|nr:formate C-acetyltransferase/glycerol dehydratase family glycyl radical enzyme [Mediterraneibacter hominis]MBC5689002.1 formate C-acetyltransferase/glycerol dehydratase family glycyl radical enzyme [Mediterraneibacter hominis]
MKKYLPDGITRQERTSVLNADMRASIPSICLERARLVTKSYKKTEGEHYLLRRAKALANVLKNMTIFIRPEEIIVGNHASKQRFAPLYPETGVLSKKELDLMPIREVDTLQITEEEKKELLEEIYPWWKHKTLEDLTWDRFPADLKEIATSPNAVFNALSRTRSGYGHYLPDIAKVINNGFQAIEAKAQKKLECLSCQDEDFTYKSAFYNAALIICEAVHTFSSRYAALAGTLAENTADPRRKKELKLIAAACTQVPYHPARNFHEALQSYWFTLLIDYIFQNGSAISCGRFDQYMYPYYLKDTDSGLLTKDEAQEMIEALWVKHNDVIKACTYNSARNNGGFSTSAHLTLGGVDKDGHDACNELTFLCLEADRNVFNCEPNIGVRINKKNPEELPQKVFEILGTVGGGKYPLFNDDVIIPTLVKDGLPLEEARNYGIVGCVEPNPYGNSLSISNACYFNLAKCLEFALTNGYCLLTNKKMGLSTGDASSFTSMTEVKEAYEKQVSYFVEKMADSLNIIEESIADYTPHIYCSLLLDDCMERGLDSSAGGSRYNYCGVQGVGAPDVGDALMAIDKLVFHEKRLSMSDLLHILHSDFKDAVSEQNMLLYEAPKYGNDIDEVDRYVRYAGEQYCLEVAKQKEWRGGKFRPGLYCVSANTPIGRQVGAMANGRKSGMPLADGGISPRQGVDENGPTAVFLSAAKLNLDLVTNGVDLNMKILPSLAKTQEDYQKLTQMLRGYFAAGGMHVQFNIISDDILKEAQKFPDAHRNLVVRVAGYSAFFVDLDVDIQNEIISRTAMQAL